MPPEVLESRPIYRGKVFSLRQDHIRLAGGKEARLDIIDHPASVTILPVDEGGDIWFVRQYRHAAAANLLELPAGTSDPGEDPRACALRECREEVGMSPGRLTAIGECWLVPGYATEYMYFFLAEDLSPMPLEQDEDEEIEVLRLSRAEAMAMAARGELKDAKTMVGLFLLANRPPQVSGSSGAPEA
jgi:ADP-ribose pyrophosphatase